MRRCVLFTVADGTLLGNLFCSAAALSELSLFLLKVRNSNLATVANEKKKGLWRASFAGKSALVHPGYAVLDKLVDALKILSEVLNALERLASFSVAVAGNV